MYAPMPNSFALAWAASEAILAASRERVGRLVVADIVIVMSEEYRWISVVALIEVRFEVDRDDGAKSWYLESK
jgi:hypothetical protein